MCIRDRLWVGLFRVFGSKPVVFISDVGSGMDSGCSVWVSGLGSQVCFARSTHDTSKSSITYEAKNIMVVLSS